jgi:Zn-dependent M28 family amino/carboxypeptidase
VLRALLILTLIVAPKLAFAANDIDPARLSEHIRTLASGPFAGREPATDGGQRTVDYVVNAFRSAGLEPGAGNESWLQPVPATRFTITGPVTASARLPHTLGHFEQGQSIMLYSQKPGSRIDIHDAPLVFVGYGITAPDLGWDDLKGENLTGKIAVALIGDSTRIQHASQAAEYGRFSKKLKNLVAHGAAGVLWIYDPLATGWIWPTAQSTFSQPQFVADNDATLEPGVEGWINTKAAAQLFAAAGADLSQLVSAADDPAFQPVHLPASFSVSFDYKAERVAPPNVIGILRGSKRPNETVIYSAHWDHLGRAPDGTVFPGAIDNASGVAALIEIARAIASGPRPERSVVFIATTLEEQGLLGARYYVERPVYPLATTVADLNMDMLMPFGRTRDAVMVGAGKNDLDGWVGRAAQAEGLKLTLSVDPGSSAYYRADHFAFAEAGVPSAFLQSGTDLLAGGTAPGHRDEFEFTTRRYHQAADAWSQEMKTDGMAQLAKVYLRAGLDLANSTAWPKWNDGIEFKPKRDESSAARR